MSKIKLLLLAVAPFAGMAGLWWLIRWAQHNGCFEWLPDWLFLDSDLSAPVATLLASGGVIIAAFIAFWNGEKTRREEKAKWDESKRQETMRSLRDRYFHISELLSENNSYTQRESAVYSLAALSDDWVNFHGNGTEAAAREQQICLDLIIGQLRGPLPEKDNHEESKEISELIMFKQRVQSVIAQRYKSSEFSSQIAWSHLDLNLSFCYLHKADLSNSTFDGTALFESTIFAGQADFGGATFRGNAYFKEATFKEEADFGGATFRGNAYFKEATFKEEARFEGATFRGNAYFKEATFAGEANFWGATFKEEARFEGATFRGNAYFKEAVFKGMSSFVGPLQFASSPQFKNAKFPTCPTLPDSGDSRKFFAQAIFLDEQTDKK